MQKKWVIYTICCAVVVICYCLFAVPAILNMGDRYKGQEVFYTEEEYSQFKTELIQSKASWRSEYMQVLSSSPPIIVKFDINNIRQDYQFPYGELIEHSQIYFVIGTSVILAIIIGMSIAMVKFEP